MNPNKLSARGARVALIAGALLAGLVTAPAQAGYATRPITLIVPFPPGGTTDVLPRLISQEVSARLGQPLIVSNRPGAGSLLGTRNTISAEPDGHTILLQTTAVVTGQAMKKQPDFDIFRDLTPVTLAAAGVFGAFATKNLPVRTIGELIAYAKANPGKLNYGSGGIGAANHLLTELFASNAGIAMTHVPYGGGAPAMAALISGEVHLLFTDAWFGKPQADQGKIKLLAITATGPNPAYPGVATVATSGGPNLEAKLWFGFLAPARTAEPIIRELNAALVAGLQQPAVRDRMQAQGLLIEATTPEGFRAFLQQEVERWNSAIDKARITRE